MKERIAIAGSGGQGVMTMGLIMAHAAMLDGLHVTWLPSYGAEQRGGDATCFVVLSQVRIWSPVVTAPDYLVALNKRGLEVFEEAVVPGGLIAVNSSGTDRKVRRTDVSAMYVPANELAREVGDEKTANMLLLGALTSATRLVNVGSVVKAMQLAFSDEGSRLMSLNEIALRRGAELVTP